MFKLSNQELRSLKKAYKEDEKEKYFIERTNKHIKLVQEAAKKIVEQYPKYQEVLKSVEHHDASKFEEPERTPYISITWRHKLEKENNEFDPLKDKGYKTPGSLVNEDENKATLHHIIHNSHHPEYWNADEASISKEDRDKSDKCLDVTEMSDIAIVEMVADWQAMSEEIKKGTARDWFEKTRDVRWHFSSDQIKLIDKLLSVFE